MSECQSNPDQWFSELPEDIERAKDGCLDCPLSRFNACQDEGWKHEFGVFGGLSHIDRKAIDPEGYAALVDRSKAKATETDHAVSVKTRALTMCAEGMMHKDVAAITGVSFPGLRKWVQRARDNGTMPKPSKAPLTDLELKRILGHNVKSAADRKRDETAPMS